jgi:hypothetical protein
MFDPLCQLAPAINGWGLFSVDGSDEQIFGADEVPGRGQSD